MAGAGCALAPKAKPPETPAASRDNRSAPALMKSGNINFSLGRYEEAVSDFTKAIGRGGGAEAYNTRGRVYFELGRYEEALSDVGEAIRLDPASDTAYNTRGYILYFTGRYGEALADLDKALKINHRHEGAYNHRGLVHAALRQFDKALADFDAALEIDPDYYEVYANKGDVLEMRGATREALVAYGEYLKRASSPRDVKRAARVRERVRALRGAPPE